MSTCLVPFNQLYLHSSGEVYPCSFVQNNPEFVLGHIQKNSLKEIWMSDSAKKLRENHLGTIPGTCEKNQDTFFCHKVSLRKGFNQHQYKLKRLDLMLDAACNLTCIMCTNIFDKSGGFKGDFFWNNNDEVFSQVEEIELVGGEPLISPYFYKIVGRVTELNNQCEWRITTNAHYAISNELVANFRKMNLQSLSISLDSLKSEVFQTIRQRSTFSLVYDNILRFKHIVPFLQINMVVQSLNCDEVIALYEWCRFHDFHFYPILLLYPSDHSLLKRAKADNKRWLLNLMNHNERLASKEIFFLIKKSLRNLDLHRDPEVLECYLEQLKLMEELGV